MDYMTIEQIQTAAKNDIDRHIKSNSFTGYEGTTDDNQENFYTITSLYTQWAKDSNEAEIALDAMYEEDYPQFNNVR